MAVRKILKQFVIHEYVGSGTTNSYGNLGVPTDVVRPSTGVVIGCTNDGNSKAVIIAESTVDKWILKFFNYATASMDSVTNTSVGYRIFYVLK